MNKQIWIERKCTISCFIVLYLTNDKSLKTEVLIHLSNRFLIVAGILFGVCAGLA